LFGGQLENEKADPEGTWNRFSILHGVEGEN
jgi:hypothetical protein